MIKRKKAGEMHILKGLDSNGNIIYEEKIAGL